MERAREEAQGRRKGGSLLPTRIWGKSGKDLKHWHSELGVMCVGGERELFFSFNYILKFFYNNISHLNSLKV